MTEYIQELDFELGLIINLFVGIALIFFGIDKDANSKSFKLKNVIILYISLSLFVIVFSPSNILILLLFGFFAGGFILLNNDEHNLEKELNRVNLIWFYSLSWFFLNKTYIWFICGILIFVLDIVLLELIGIDNETHLYIIICLITLFMLYHYISVAVDIFDFHSFSTVQERLNISVIKNPPGRSESCSNENVKLMSFLLFMVSSP